MKKPSHYNSVGSSIGAVLGSSLGSLLRSNKVQQLTRDSLLKMDPEIAHQTTIAALRLGMRVKQPIPDSELLKTHICGLEFKNPIGMAAGFDKNAQVSAALGDMGFGFCEVGTITPRPQEGNEKPRLFRLLKQEAIINRMGFNNEGHEAAYKRLKKQTKDHKLNNIVGVNIGANKDSEDFVADYVSGVKLFSDVADYLTMNISSPNTKGLRDLQSNEALKRLLGETLAERARAKIFVPIFLKIAPDLNKKQLDEIAKLVIESDLDGLVISNTTISRDMIEKEENSEEKGGLSGKPIFNLSTQKLAQMRLRVGNDLPIIGVGGIYSAKSAIEKLKAGANAIQLYSALVYGGMELIDEIKAGLVIEVRKGKHNNVDDLVGLNVKDWASGKVHI